MNRHLTPEEEEEEKLKQDTLNEMNKRIDEHVGRTCLLILVVMLAWFALGYLEVILS